MASFLRVSCFSLLLVVLLSTPFIRAEAQLLNPNGLQVSAEDHAALFGTSNNTANTGGGGSGANTGGGGTGANTGGGGTGANTGGGGIGDPGGENNIPVLENPLKNIDSLPELLNVILDAIVQIGVLLLVIMLVWVGFLFVMARGNPEEISKARSALLWTLIGGLILLGAKAISEVLQATVGSLTS